MLWNWDISLCMFSNWTIHQEITYTRERARCAGSTG
jgi:hypothetical protein